MGGEEQGISSQDITALLRGTPEPLPRENESHLLRKERNISKSLGRVYLEMVRIIVITATPSVYYPFTFSKHENA